MRLGRRTAPALVAVTAAVVVVGCGGPDPSKAPLSESVRPVAPRVRPSASRHVEGTEAQEDREPQQVEISIDEGDDDSTGSGTAVAGPDCEARRREAEAACPDSAVLCRERAREVRCQAP